MWKPLGQTLLADLSAAVGLSIATGEITDASNAAPIVIESVGHGFEDGQLVIIEGVGGNEAANGQFVVANADADTFELAGSTGDGAYTSGGVWRRLPEGAQFVQLTVTGQHVRYRDDGTDPTASIGQLLKTTDPPFVYPGDLQAIRFIETSSSGKVNASFYRQ